MIGLAADEIEFEEVPGAAVVVVVGDDVGDAGMFNGL